MDAGPGRFPFLATAVPLRAQDDSLAPTPAEFGVDCANGILIVRRDRQFVRDSGVNIKSAVNASSGSRFRRAAREGSDPATGGDAESSGPSADVH